MASPNHTNLIQKLSSLPRGRPLNTSTLKALGVSSPLASYYVRAGWLTRLGRGTFAFPGDTLELNDSVKFLEQKFAGLHVGGRTALSWRGVRHNLPTREKVVLWGTTKAPLPAWFTDRFQAEYVTRTLFDAKMERDYGMQTLPSRTEGALVSTPERALLEMLDAVGLNQEMDEARKIMDGLQSVRLNVLGHLLEHCRRVKVVRMCLQWSEELKLTWAAAASELPSARGTGRWVKKLSDGSTMILKP